MTEFTAREEAEIAAAAQSGQAVVVFVHGLWLLPSSWDRWRTLFEEDGYATVAPGWPGDPETIEDARREPSVFAGNTVGTASAHHLAVIQRLYDDTGRLPALVGHSFGGLIVQQLAGKGIAAATVAVDPAPFRGVLPVPLSALRSSAAVVAHPTRSHVTLTYKQFKYGWANNLSDEEARRVYDEFHVAAPGAPIRQAVAANLNPRSQTRVDTDNPGRGPLLIVSGEKDHTVPRAIAHASYARQRHNVGVTKFTEIPGRGHSLTIDDGWRAVADIALEFISTHAPARRAA